MWIHKHLYLLYVLCENVLSITIYKKQIHLSTFLNNEQAAIFTLERLQKTFITVENKTLLNNKMLMSICIGNVKYSRIQLKNTINELDEIEKKPHILSNHIKLDRLINILVSKINTIMHKKGHRKLFNKLTFLKAKI